MRQFISLYLINNKYNLNTILININILLLILLLYDIII